jgi:hypothetical protein
LIAFPTASSSSTIATIGPLFGTWFDRQSQDSFYGATDVARDALLIQPRRNCCVLRLYDCIGTIGFGRPEILWPMQQAGSPSSTSFHLASVSSKEPLQLRAGGARERPAGSDRPRGRRTSP